MAAAPRRIFVDSRFSRLEGDNTPPYKFTVQYPEGVEYLSANTRLYVTQFSLTQTLPTIHATSFQLAWLEYDTANGFQARLIGFTPGQYTGEELRATLQAEMNSGTPLGSYVVTLANNKLTISGTGGAGYGFRMFGDRDVRAWQWKFVWNGLGGDPSFVPEHNCGRQFGIPNLFDPVLDSFQTSPPNPRIGPITNCEHLDARGVAELYLACPELSRNDTLSPWGSRDIIAKIPVTEGFGGILQERGGNLADDHVQVGRTTFRRLTFRLLDAYGTLLRDLQGSASWTLLFVE
jgi:hypothetical protein